MSNRPELAQNVAAQPATNGRQPGNGATDNVIAEHALRPDADIFEDADAITVALDLPGVDTNALDIRVDKQSLTVEAEANIQLAAGTQPIHAEVRSKHYRRSFTLSTELEGDRIEANLKDGVLKLRIPKRAEVKPRRIEVRAQ
jgi:HSP20 family molecular chaperone IbpA